MGAIPLDSILPRNSTDEAINAENQPEAMFGDPVVAKALKNIERHKSKIEKQREHAKAARKFKAGQQFEAADLAVLQAELRPSAAFNVAQKFIRVVSGLERRSREHIDFVPTEITDAQMGIATDVVNKAYQWVMNKTHGDDERSRAFEDKLVDGIGWTETYLDTSHDPGGLIALRRRDMMEMLWDTHARETNNTDMTWVARIRLVPFDEALLRWPDKEAELILMKGESGSGDSARSIRVDLYNWAVSMSQFGGPQPTADTLGQHGMKDMVPVIDYEWKEYKNGYLFFDPLDRDDVWLDEDKFREYESKLERLGLPPITDKVRQIKPKHQRILFTGKARLIDPVDLPGERFTYNCMTGTWDDENGLWLGFMSLLMDPQRFANKFLNQALEIMKTQSKGGLMAETDAFRNPRQAEQEYAKTGSILWVNPGALAGGKLMERQLPQMPSSSIQLMQFCVGMLQEVTGVGPEAFGMAAGEVPVGTSQLRANAGYALLSSEFSALRRYRVEEAKTVFDFFQFISDGRLIRVGGPLTSQFIQLIRDPFLMTYDVLIEESDSDPNLKQRYFEAIMQITPMLVRSNQFLPELLDYFPLPRRVIEQLKQAMVEKKQQDAQMRAQGLDPTGRGKQDPPEMRQAKIQKLNAESALIAMKAQTLQGKGKTDLADAMLKVLTAQEQARAAQEQEHLGKIGMANQLLTHLRGGGQPQPPQGGQE